MTTLAAPLEDKYGRPLTSTNWSGLPMFKGEIPATGFVHDLEGEHDALLIWSGGTSDVSILGSRTDAVGSREQRHHFTRHAGMIDLLPRGTTIKEIQWTGAASTCVSVALPREVTRQLTSGPNDGLDAQRGPRYGLVDAHLVDLAWRLQEQVDTNFPLGPVYVQGISLALAAYVSAKYGGGAEVAEPQGGFDDVQRAVLVDYVETHVGLNIGLIDLASLVGYSPDHFTRLFKISFGTTPHRYLLERRVARAKTLLRERRHSLAEIAFDCGFSGQTHLNVVFKRLTGSTPGAFRKH